ncbi:MAG: 50S ribosomal protein L1 [bacterium]|nr:50S ribosomal protein L1 [bacterium]
MPKIKEDSAKKKRLHEKSARIGEPENIFDLPVDESVQSVDTSSETNAQSSSDGSVEAKVEKAPKKPKQPKGKKYLAAKLQVKKTEKYTLEEAIELVKKTSYSSFNGTVEAHVTLSDKDSRGMLSLPHGTGKNVKVLAFVNATKSQEAKDAGADIIGAEDVVAKVKSNQISPGKDFTAVVATPDMMAIIAPLAKMLGPKGLMPNPKTSTVGVNIGQMITNLKKGQFNYKAELTNPNVVHLPIGKVSFTTAQLIENFEVVKAALGASKIKSLTLSSTMGPGVKVTL